MAKNLKVASSPHDDAERHKRAQRVQALLDLFEPNPLIPLDHKDAYTLLIAVLLSAQTTDERVNKVTPALFARASTPQQMAKLKVEEILELIRTCGLAPFKAKAIRDLSQILVDKYRGEVPCDFEALESLPGVGHKTASVVMSQAFGIPAFPVDTHILRVSHRWGLSDDPKSFKNAVRTEKFLKNLYPPSTWNKLHLQMVWYGRKECTARGCDGKTCRICQDLCLKL